MGSYRYSEICDSNQGEAVSLPIRAQKPRQKENTAITEGNQKVFWKYICEFWRNFYFSYHVVQSSGYLSVTPYSHLNVYLLRYSDMDW